MTDCASTASTTPTLRVRGPGDLIELVPYLLGFVPARSLVLVGLTAAPAPSVAVTMRLDLIAAARPLARADCVRALRTAAAAAVVLIVYVDDAAADLTGSELPAVESTLTADSRVVDGIASATAEAGVEVADALVVGGGRWRSLLCGNPACCPAEGLAIAGPSEPSNVMVAATVAGLSALPDRAALESALAPEAAALREPVATAIRGVAVLDLGRARALWSAAVDAHRRPATAIEASAAASMLVALGDIEYRDWCCAWADAGDPADAVAAESVARSLARLATAPHAAAAYALLAWLAWRRGDGTTARIAADHAIDSDSGYPLAVLIGRALDCAIDPRRCMDAP